jgi:hypothetical protein
MGSVTGIYDRLIQDVVQSMSTSMEQSSILSSGRLLFDRDNGMSDGDPSFKERRDP